MGHELVYSGLDTEPRRVKGGRKMGTAFEERVRECVPSEATYVNIEASKNSRSMLELGDGSLLGVRGATGSLSGDGGMTWSEPEALMQADGSEMEGSLRHLARLKSGHIGAFWSEPGRDGGRERQYQQSEWFRVSEDDGKTWSESYRVSEPYNNAVIHNEAAVTSNGRIVASTYNLVGKTLRGGSLGIGPTTRAMFGDKIARVGAHGYEHFFTYCWAYYSDDEGRTWSANDGKGKWGAGGELFVTLDFSAGGHWRCNEPAIAEVSPDHLLMLMRTPLGRFYQSWSSDNGTIWSHPEPSSLATALAPAAMTRLPGTGDLLVIWNQASPDEIEKGLQRHRLSAAISKDGGTTWLRSRNIFSVYGEHDRTYVEPPPIQNYRAVELSPRIPLNDIQGTYPFISLWKDQVIVRFGSSDRAFHIADPVGTRRYDQRPESARGHTGSVQISLPLAWFYEELTRFG